jgi:hypothetical protein
LLVLRIDPVFGEYLSIIIKGRIMVVVKVFVIIVIVEVFLLIGVVIVCVTLLVLALLIVFRSFLIVCRKGCLGIKMRMRPVNYESMFLLFAQTSNESPKVTRFFLDPISLNDLLSYLFSDWNNVGLIHNYWLYVFLLELI